MRIVDRPALRPMRCAAVPFIGATHQGRFVDTGTDLTGGFDNRVYISDVAVGEMARMFGYVSQGEHRSLQAALDASEKALAVAQAALVEAERKLDAVDVMESAGFRARKKPGRPKVEA